MEEAVLWSNNGTGIGYGDTLLVTNNNSSDAITSSNYFKIRSPDIEQLNVTTSTDEVAKFSVVNSTIYAPIKTYLIAHPEINYIVLSMDFPLFTNETESGGGSNQNASSLESEIMLLNGPSESYIGQPSYFLNNLFNSPTSRPYNHTQYGKYLVTRLDGYNYTDVEGMINRSIKIKRGDLLAGTHVLAFNGGYYFNNFNSVNATFVSQGLKVNYTKSGVGPTNQSNVSYFASYGCYSYPSGGACHSGPASSVITNPNFTWVNGTLADVKFSFSARADTLPFRPDPNLDYYPYSIEIFDYIHEGATGGSGYAIEPLESGTLIPDIMASRYLSGYNLAETLWGAASDLSWSQVVVGDPKMQYPVAVTTFNPSRLVNGSNLSVAGYVIAPRYNLLDLNWTWYKNGVKQASGNISSVNVDTNFNITSLTSGNFTVGDVWKLETTLSSNNEELSRMNSSALTVESGTLITACQFMNSANTIYLLGANLTSPQDQPCMTVNATGTTLDCNGYTINFNVSQPDTTAYPVSIPTVQSPINIINCNFKGDGINTATNAIFENANDQGGTIANNNFTNFNAANIALQGGDFWYIENNTFNLIPGAYGITASVGTLSETIRYNKVYNGTRFLSGTSTGFSGTSNITGNFIYMPSTDNCTASRSTAFQLATASSGVAWANNITACVFFNVTVATFSLNNSSAGNEYHFGQNGSNLFNSFPRYDNTGDHYADGGLPYNQTNIGVQYINGSGSLKDFFPYTDLSNCFNMNTTGKAYQIISDITGASGTCINAPNENATLNCNGFTVYGTNSSGNFGINQTANNVSFTNCMFQNFSTAMQSTANNTTIISTILASSAINGTALNLTNVQNLTFNFSSALGTGSAVGINSTYGKYCTISDAIITGLPPLAFQNGTGCAMNRVTLTPISGPGLTMENMSAIIGFEVTSSAIGTVINFGAGSQNNSFTNISLTSTTGPAINFSASSRNNSIVWSSITSPIWINNQNETNAFNDSKRGNAYYFTNGTLATTRFLCTDTDVPPDGYCDNGTIPYNASTVGGNWTGLGGDFHPFRGIDPATISIISPQNITYNGTSILVNLSTTLANVTWFNWNGTDQIYTTPVNITFTSGGVIFNAYANNSNGQITSANVNFTVVTFTQNNSTETQVGFASPNTPVQWSQTISVTDSGTCLYNISKQQVQNLTAILQNDSTPVTNNGNYTNLNFSCSAGNSPYTIQFYTEQINQTDLGLVSFAGIAGTIQHEITAVSAAAQNISYQFSYLPGSASPHLYLCNQNTVAACSAPGAPYTLVIHGISGSAITYLSNLASNETVFVVAWDEAGGSSSGGYIVPNPTPTQNNTTIQPQPVPVPIIQTGILENAWAVLDAWASSNTGGLQHLWIIVAAGFLFIAVCMAYFVYTKHAGWLVLVLIAVMAILFAIWKWLR